MNDAMSEDQPKRHILTKHIAQKLQEFIKLNLAKLSFINSCSFQEYVIPECLVLVLFFNSDSFLDD